MAFTIAVAVALVVPQVIRQTVGWEERVRCDIAEGGFNTT